MSRRSEGAREGELFVGRLNKHTRSRDLEDVFEQYGRLSRCEVKYGAEMAYAFIDYEDRRDAEDAIKYENGRDLNGASIIVEWAKGNPRRPQVSSTGYDECYKCHRVGHWARDCTEGGGFRGGGGGGGGYRGGGGRGRSRSRSPYRRSRGRSSYSGDRSYDRRRSRSRSRDRSRRRRSRSRSPRRERSVSRSRSRSLAENGRQKRDSQSPT